jgi:hypothetical protein
VPSSSKVRSIASAASRTVRVSERATRAPGFSVAMSRASPAWPAAP